MNGKTLIVLELAICLACSVNSQAQITLNGKPQMFGQDSMNADFAVVEKPDYNLLDSSGFEEIGFNYIVTSELAGPTFQILGFSEKFNLGQAAQLTETVSGYAKITVGGMGNGYMINASGLIDGFV